MNWSHVKVTVSGSNTLTITFPSPIDQLVAPLVKNGELPAEFAAAALAYVVAAQKAAAHGVTATPAQGGGHVHAPW